MKNETVKSNVPGLSMKISMSGIPHNVRPYIPLHFHDEIELLPVFAGEFICMVDGKEYVAREGDVIFINSRIPHTTRCRCEGALTGILQFRLKDFIDTEIERIVRYSIKYRTILGEPVRIVSDPAFFAVIKEVLEEANAKENAYEMFIKAGLYRALGILYRKGILSDGEKFYQKKEVQKILPALSFINEHYAEDVTLEGVSTMLGFNQSYFCRIFKLATGTTFTEYLNFVRVCKAEKILVTTQDSILDISLSVGISSVSYFNRIFKKYHNCSPSFFRTVQYLAN